jgi:hypothetical protein
VRVVCGRRAGPQISESARNELELLGRALEWRWSCAGKKKERPDGPNAGGGPVQVVSFFSFSLFFSFYVLFSVLFYSRLFLIFKYSS